MMTISSKPKSDNTLNEECNVMIVSVGMQCRV